MRVVFLQSFLVSALVLAGLLGRDGLTGNVPWFGRGDFAFAVDVPDGLGAFNPSGLDRFTLRQIQNPAPGSDVPDPSLLFLSLGGVVDGSRRLRARR